MVSQECEDFWPQLQGRFRNSSSACSRRILIPTGVSALPYIQDLAAKYANPIDQIEVFAVENHFFGSSVTVTGLITGEDLTKALHGYKADKVLISCSMLKENEDLFLDNYTVSDVEKKTGLSIRVVKNQGEDFLNALYGY